MEELKSRICDEHTLAQRINQWRLRDEKIVFTNGCFDLLHSGHLKLLSEAKSQGQRLIVAVNTDDSVQKLKGPNRPVKNQNERSLCLASVLFIDAVILFSEDTPERLIRFVKPDVLVKGSDYSVETVVGADFVIKNGGRVHLVELIEGKSSSNLIDRLKA